MRRSDLITPISRTVVYAFLFLVSALTIANADTGEKPQRESIEWTDIWVAHADESELPRVLLVGDSITRGYHDGVDKALNGKAYCARYTTSKYIGHADFLEELKVLLKTYRFHVIHINSGLHGWAYTEEQYADSFPKLFRTLKKYAGNATLIWASTTPVRTGENLAGFNVITARVQERNRIATQFMRDRAVPINDLYALVEPHADFYAQDGTHFNAQGKAAQAAQVAELVSRYLPDRTQPPRD